MKIAKVENEIEIPSGVSIEVKENMVHAKGPKGTIEREFKYPGVLIEIAGNKISVKSHDVNKRKKRMLSTYTAHLKNIIEGVTKGFNYKLKICSGHFPMNVSVAGADFVVKNFLGEKVPRAFKLKQGVKVTINGQIIDVDGADIEIVSQTAASIEKLTRRAGFDFNRFQDGIYIIEKAGEKQ